MSKLFTILAALAVASAAGVAGYVYYSGSTLRDTLAPPGESGCSQCELAKKRRSCCDGDALAKALALAGDGTYVGETTVVGCSLTPSNAPALSAVLGGFASTNSVPHAAFGGCCESGFEVGNGLSAVTGVAVTVAAK